MKQVYKCDFCNKTFETKADAEMHEERCGHNPNNKINNKLVFRLSMIYETLPRIIACALYEVANDELDFLYAETERADETNCPYTIKKNKNSMLYVLSSAETVKNKHTGRNSSTYKDVIKEYPELFQAMVDTLRRKAWNETER